MSSPSAVEKPPVPRAGPLTFTRLKWTSFFHSVVYLSLIACALAGLALPTLVLGWTHGILWIAMSTACILAVRQRVIPFRVGIAVAVLGGFGPFIGSYEFIREQRRRMGWRSRRGSASEHVTGRSSEQSGDRPR